MKSNAKFVTLANGDVRLTHLQTRTVYINGLPTTQTEAVDRVFTTLAFKETPGLLRVYERNVGSALQTAHQGLSGQYVDLTMSTTQKLENVIRAEFHKTQGPDYQKTPRATKGRSVQLVATPDFIKTLVANQYNAFRDAAAGRLFPPGTHVPAEWNPATDGPLSAKFAVDPSACKTKLGAWLAEHAVTTRFSDPFSLLSIEVARSDEDAETTRFLASVHQPCSLRSVADFERLQAEISAWLARRAAVVKMYGEVPFKTQSLTFKWPVFGSAVAMGADTPEEYFDLCAKIILGFKPTKVVFVAKKMSWAPAPVAGGGVVAGAASPA